MTREALKPCPFCGSQYYRRIDDGPGGQSIQCAGCYAATGVLDTQRQATLAWNRRVSIEATTAQVALEKARGRLLELVLSERFTASELFKYLEKYRVALKELSK